MTQAERLASTTTLELYRHPDLPAHWAGRKAMPFGCGRCRHVWNDLHPALRDAVAVAEQAAYLRSSSEVQEAHAAHIANLLRSRHGNCAAERRRIGHGAGTAEKSLNAHCAKNRVARARSNRSGWT